MKSFFKVMAGAVMVCTVATLTGCGFLFDPQNPQIPISTLSGFKTTFNDGTYALDDTFEKYSKHILTEVYANFAMPATIYHKSKLTISPTTTQGNFDKIRVQVNNEKTVQNIAWKWTFSRALLGCESEYEFDNIVDKYSTETIQDKYYNEWTSLYAIPLEIVSIQIAMGQTPQVFSVNITEQTTTIYTDNSLSKKVDENYLAEVKEQFKNQGTYVGFTEENLLTFKNYFLNEIVGSSIVETQYDKIVMSNGETTYGALFDKILTLNVDGVEKNFYTPYPASFVKDVTDNTFFAGKEHYVLDHVTAREYQTVTFMTSKDTYVLGFHLAFEAEYDLTLDVKVTFFNNKTQNIENYYNDTIQIKAGKFDAKNWKTISLNKKLDVSEFKNSTIPASTQTQISNTNQNSKYFTYSPSGTYLEGQLLECDCLTISFCPQKTQNVYCPFKWVIDLEMEA